jgi:hypothetical protein
MGLLATAVGWNRRLLEDLLLRVKEGQLAPDDGTETGTPESERELAPVLPLRHRAAERVKVA